MVEKFNCLFHYFEKENIKVDKVEFLFQIQSHPDYPSILAIADALTFFNIKNGVIRVDVSEIELLPYRFVALLIEKNDQPLPDTRLYFVERKGDFYFCIKDRKRREMSKAELESSWNNIVLLIENEDNGNFSDIKGNNSGKILPLLCLVLFISILFLIEENLKTKLFLLLPAIGILFSIAALKDLFGAKSELLNSFCTIRSSLSCTSVVESTKWKIFKIINFSDLSIVFFISQFIGMLMFLFMAKIDVYFSIQKIMLLCSIPLLFTSIYYQKIVEKKWCPICLVIICVILLELADIIFLCKTSFVLEINLLIIYGFIFVTVALGWLTLKNLLSKQKELKEFQFTGNRFMRNYEIFKNSLLSENSVDLPNSPIVLGNQDSNTEITVITSPFCGHCESVHKFLEQILIKNPDKLKIKMIFNADFDFIEGERKVFFRCLIAIYLEKGAFSFMEALNFWFENKNLKEWIKKYELPFESEKINSIYKAQNQWCKAHAFNFTPVIFVNSFVYPNTYNRENLQYFVNELIEDVYFELV